MEKLSKAKTEKKKRPIKVIQFGEGNFLRAFADYMIDIANEQSVFDGDIIIVKPIAYGDLKRFHEQECQYTVSLRGMVDGKAKVQNRVITSVADAVDSTIEYEKYIAYAQLDSLRFVVSNTTEAGIVYDDSDLLKSTPPQTFPGKLTQFLYIRYMHFQGNREKGLIMLPVELIDDNGINLKKCVQKLTKLWGLGDDFQNWLEEACIFTSTLVDRIVTGYPKEEAEEIWKEFDYKDELLVTAEPFALWVIESPKDIAEELPLDKAGLPVIFTDDQRPYKQRKVRILNGAHTSFVLASFLCGNNTVLESMEKKYIYDFMHHTIFDEIIGTLTLPEKELIAFANAVIERFQNPYVKHSLLSISLNSVSKWKARCMPSFLRYLEKEKEVPKHLAFSLAALMAFYTGREMRDLALVGNRAGEEYLVRDDENVLRFFMEKSNQRSSEYVKAVLSNTAFWGQDLSVLDGVYEVVLKYLEEIHFWGMSVAMQHNFNSSK